MNTIKGIANTIRKTFNPTLDEIAEDDKKKRNKFYNENKIANASLLLGLDCTAG